MPDKYIPIADRMGTCQYCEAGIPDTHRTAYGLTCVECQSIISKYPELITWMLKVVGLKLDNIMRDHNKYDHRQIEDELMELKNEISTKSNT